MVSKAGVKNLVKILIGAAWIDGKIQPEERQYLREIANAKGIADDPDIKPWLYELVPVKPEECYLWVQEYLGDNPTPEECQNLVQAISGLIYSDGEVATEEAKLLNKLQSFAEADESQLNSILKQIQKLYRRWVDIQF
ncbi:tellurite resistance TerB family protein [Calothrix sp. NIES-3974]|uniref:tellurite resistance TerB family protein n=1 Tax=Calothrix sp. NIES-3974 TaxID=2005462 RepID=UPI000B5EC91D|nr:TerB family tellurite resistance protein [Calothrix sp. NIES-3974]BAZ07943.1 hypothetical protein NIES3974_46100 [Calothrix sp. NIES-3974]